MSVCRLDQTFTTNGHDLVLSGSGSIERHPEFNSTRSKDDISRITLEVESAISSTIVDETLWSDIHNLYALKKSYLYQRNDIIKSTLKSLFYRKKLQLLDSMLEDINYNIYLIESDSTKKLIKSAEQKLKESTPHLAEMRKKYGSQQP